MARTVSVASSAKFQRTALVALLTLGLLGRALAAPLAQNPTAAQGQVVYEHWCAPCHAAGPGHPGTQSLQLKYGGKLPAVLLERTDLAPYLPLG